MWWPKLSLFAPPLRVAVVGAGAIGGEFALRHFGRLTGTSVVGVVDCNEAAARSLASSVGCPSFTSLREALEACDPELIYIGTPPSTHRELVEASLAASRHVLLEKPLAASGADGDAIVAAAEAAASRGVLLGLNIGMRWNEAQVRMRQLALEERAVGRLSGGSLELHFAAWPRPWQRVPWCAGRAEGGPLREVGTHFLFGLQEIFGARCVRRVRATVTYPADRRLCESGAEGELELDGLVLALRVTTDGSATEESGGDDRYELRLDGEGGRSLLLEDFTSLRLEQPLPRGSRTMVERAPYGRRESVESVAGAVRKMRGERDGGSGLPAPRITAREAREAQAVLDAILASDGEWVVPEYL